MATVGLLQADGKMPNLALMKLSYWLKQRGHAVVFPWQGEPVDRIFGSVIFTKSRPEALALKQKYGKKLTLGGTGWSIPLTLPKDVEACPADYSLYGMDYGLGFTSRGCIRNCAFCVVPEKEGRIRAVSTLAQIKNPLSNRIVLLDNNFLASPTWREILTEATQNKYTLSFPQGLDIRLVTEESASMLAKVPIYNWKFKSKCIHFAYDDPNMKDTVIRGIGRLIKAGIKPYKLMFYVLTGFDTTWEQDWERFKILTELKCNPFIMQYKDPRSTGDTPADIKLRHFARFVNKRVYKISTWDDYRPWKKIRDQVGE